MLIQLFSHTIKDYTVKHSNFTTTPWPGALGSGSHSGNSAIASPRSKATKVNYTSSESNIILHFVKTNLRSILKVISSEMHKKEGIKINKNEFDTLRIIMRIVENDEYKEGRISDLCELFDEGKKVLLTDIYDWVSNHLADNDKFQNIITLNNLTY